MAKDTLAVYDPNHLYVERFLSYIHAQKDFSLNVVGFTDLCILQDYLQNNRIKASLFSLPDNISKEAEENSIREMVRNNVVINVLGEKTEASEWIESFLDEEYIKRINIVEKYQSAREILNDIEENMKEHMGSSNQLKSRKFNLAAIYSPADKVSHPEKALKLIKQLTSELEIGIDKVLYINLEQFSGLGDMLEQKGEGNVSDLIYYYKTNPSKLPEMIRKARGKYKNMYILQAAANIDDLYELDADSWPDFLALLSNSCGVKLILFDLSVFIYKLVCGICKYGNLYIPALPYKRDETEISVLSRVGQDYAEDYRKSEYKLNEFKEYLVKNNYLDILDKMLELEI